MKIGAFYIEFEALLSSEVGIEEALCVGPVDGVVSGRDGTSFPRRILRPRE